MDDAMICRCCGFDIEADAITFDNSLYHDICGRKLWREREARNDLAAVLRDAQQLLAELVVNPVPTTSIATIYARAREVELSARAALARATGEN